MPDLTFAAADVERLFRVARHINSRVEFDALLPGILDAAIEVAAADRGFLALLEEGRPVLRVSRNLEGEDIAGPGTEISDGVLQGVLSSGRSVVSAGAQEDARFGGFASIQALGLRSVFCVPLREDGRVVGALYLDSARVAPLSLDRTTLVLELLAEQAAVAIGKARTHEELRRRGEDLARSLERIEELNRRLEGKVGEQAREIRRFEGMVAREHEELAARFPRMLGSDPCLLEVRRALERAARVDYPVLILGESGTGKEVAAVSIHEAGLRARRPMVSVNCAAFSPTLLDAQLFGHARGAFTGADRARRGFLEAAHHGTLFLDEFGDLSSEAQAKLLRVVEQGEFFRIGEDAPTAVDVRLILATHRDLPTMVREGRFREDLYFRLNTILVRLPPLRERRRDVRLLAEHFLARAAREVGGVAGLAFSEEAFAVLEARPWRGNARELLGVVRRAVLGADGDRIEPRHLVFDGEGGAPAAPSLVADPLAPGLPEDLPPRVRSALARWPASSPLTFRGYRAVSGVSRATAAKDLGELVRRGILVKTGRTAGVVYRPARARPGGGPDPGPR